MGELGWSLERWRYSTFIEFNYAVGGYWRNWERFAAFPMREINFVNIAGNPNIKNSSKPKTATEYFKLSIDEQKKEVERPTQEDIELAQKLAFYGKAET
jgi:hypothetical protein